MSSGSVEPILTARGLVKRYGRVVALDHADFDLLPGEILGVIGDNGAGKSTLIKAIAGAVIPDQGEIRLDGQIHDPQCAAQIHAEPEIDHEVVHFRGRRRRVAAAALR